MIVCPPKHRKEYQELVAQLGEGKAHAAWIINGRDKIPTVDEAKELLLGNNSVIISKMNEFVKGLNFNIQQFNDLKDITGYDAVSAVDLINKVVLYGNGVGIDEVAKETAYVAYAMLGRKNKIVTDLRHSITELPDYKEILNHYKKKAPGLYTGKINELIVVDLIADAIKENGELPKDSYQNRKSEFWSIEGSSPLEKRLKYLIAKFISAIKEFLGKSKLNAKELKSLADDLANDILTKNYSKFQTKLRPDQQLVNYKDTIQKDPKAAAIVEDLQKIGLTLTGSLSLRKQGTLYRTASENLHDLDFTFQNIRNTFIEQVYVDANLNDLIEAVDTKSVKQLNKQLDKIPLIKDIVEKYPDYQVVNTFTAGKYTTIIGKIGEYAIDIFVDPTKSEQLDTIEDNFQDWKHIFAAKIQMGRAKDMLDFVNYKPFNRDESGQFAQMKGLRHFTFPTGTAEEGIGLTSAKFEGLSQQGPVQYTGKDTMTGWGSVRDTKGISYSNITVDGWAVEDMKGKDIMEIIARKNELQEQGAVIRYMGENGFQWRIPDNQYQLTASGVAVDQNLDKKVEQFLKSLGVQVQKLKDKGQNFAAMVDTINGIISVVEGKAGIETLGHEATHMFLDLLPEDSKLLRDILDQVETTDQYDSAYEQYSKLPEYTLPDGSVNKIKIAKEAAAHVIDDIIVQRYKNKKALKWWEKLWRYIQNMFRGKSLDAFSTVAEDILRGSTKKLSKEKLARIKEAHDRGEIYYELSDRDKAYIKGVQGMATVAQKKAIDDLVNNPQVILDNSVDPTTGEKKHNYINLKTGELYTSTTAKINGETHLDPKAFAANKDWGNDFDNIMQAIALGKGPEEITDIERLTPEQVQEAYKVLSEFYQQVTGPGDVVLTQVVVYDHATKTAGSIDLLVIHPDGTRDIIDLKTIGRDKPYTGKGFLPGEGSVFNEPLNRKQKNAIQVATYRRMLSVMGYPNSKISAIYVKLDIEGEEVDQVLRGFEKGDWVPFTETSWDTYAQKIVPTEGTVDKETPDPIYTEEEMTPDNEGTKINTEVPEEVTQKLEDTLTDIQNIYESRLRYFEAKEKGGGAYIPNKRLIKRVEELLYDISQDRDANQQVRAYGRFLTYAQNEVDTWIRYVGNKENRKKSNYFSQVDEVMKFMKSYQGLPWVRQGTNAGQQSMVQKLEDSLDTLGKIVSVGAFEYIKERVSETYPNLKEGDVESLLQIQQDISKSALLGSDIAGSRDPLLAALDITVKRALDEIARAREEMRSKLTDAANEFAKVNGPITKKSFDFMYNGKKLLGKVADTYYAIRDQVMSTQYDEDGKLMEYRINAKSPEDIEYNKNLFYVKQTIREFMDPDGEYHEYTPEFIAARKKVMRLQKGKYFDRWVKRGDVSDGEYQEFRREYMTYNPYYKMVTKKGIPTGVVERVNDDRAWFPNKEYIQIREETKDGRDMVNPRYRKLMNPATPLEEAQKKVYELYMQVMMDYTDKMGPEAQKWLMDGNRIAMMGGWLQKAEDEGILKAAGKLITNGFTPTIFAETTVTDETGATMQSIPKLYMGGLRNQQKIVQLDNKILDLTTQYEQGKIDKKTYRAQMEELKYQLVKEKSRPAEEDLEYDVFKQLIAYADMAENYIKLSEIEGTVKAYERMIVGDIKNIEYIDGKAHVREGRKYYDVSGKGLPITGVGTTEPAPKQDPNTIKRVRNYLSQVFYNDPNMTKDRMEVMVKRVMNYTSLISVGLNLFGNINNYVLGKVNDLVDASSGKFYDRDAYLRAQKQFDVSLIPGIIAKQTITQGPYKKKVYGSKEEALIDKYRVVREQKSGEERMDWFKDIPIIGKLPYGGAQLGEYSSQGVPGLAILMSTDENKTGIRTMKNSTTGETVSVADAHDFIDGKLVLREGFTESPEELFRTTNYIFEVNKNIHGSYAQEDAMGIIKEWGLLGKMVAQFHKHIMPALRSRFAKNYVHPTLGEYEGRYVSIAEFLKDLKNYTGVWNRVMMSWKNLTPLQKKNFLQTGAEMVMVMTAYATYVLVSGIAKGLDPDEDPTLKRMANFLSYQSSRLYSEGVAFTFTPPGAVQMYQYIRNPMAISSIAKNFAQALLSTSEWPLQVTETGPFQLKDAYYQRGPFKGELKSVRQWKKVLPILNNLDKWSSFSELGHFSLIGS